MAIIIFLVILVILIMGHEAGHFIVAKLSGMKVPEFGLGFPPKLWGKKIGDTEYTINALPFGGFVKIFGEDDAGSDDPRAFARRPKLLQAATLAAGPFANIVLALVFSTVAFMVGIPALVDTPADAARIKNPHVLLLDIIPESPAAVAGLKAGDRVLALESNGVQTLVDEPIDISTVVRDSKGSVTFTVLNAGVERSVVVTPKAGIDTTEPEKRAVGVAPALVGTLSLPLHEAFVRGIVDTIEKTQQIFLGLVSLIVSAFTFSADISNVAGPVGIVSLVGDASGFGLGSILALAGLISINLAIVNLLPFPALDGGRLFLLLIETLTRRRIPSKISDSLNIGGFVVLILLMLAVTANDIFRLFQ